MWLKSLQKLCCLEWILNRTFCAPLWRKHCWITRRTILQPKAFLVHKKKNEYSFELSLSICVFKWCIFISEMRNFSLENHHMVWFADGSLFYTLIKHAFQPIRVHVRSFLDNLESKTYLWCIPLCFGVWCFTGFLGSSSACGCLCAYQLICLCNNWKPHQGDNWQ